MRRTWIRAGIGLLALTGPAFADVKRDDPARARAAMLDRLQAQLASERAEALATAGRLTGLGPMVRHARAARSE